MIPERDVKPTVGLRPTILARLEGMIILPAVSVPIAAAHNPALVAIAEPLLLPLGSP
jgi:hypothetical protein